MSTPAERKAASAFVKRTSAEMAELPVPEMMAALSTLVATAICLEFNPSGHEKCIELHVRELREKIAAFPGLMRSALSDCAG